MLYMNTFIPTISLCELTHNECTAISLELWLEQFQKDYDGLDFWHI
jgi:hypothetical protein